MTMMMMMKVDGALQKEMDERNLRPRLCYLTKGERGYGFHLHGERGSGAQFIRRIEAGSPAELAGLRSGDRVVEVNGENVEKESHHQVVQKIMEVENRTRLLVVDRETDEFLLLHSLPCTEDLAVEMSCLSSPRASSSSLASSTLSFTSSLRDSLTPSPSDSIALSPRDFATHSLSGTVTSLMLPQSTTSSPPGSSDPLPSDSIILSPQNSTPSPEDSINQSPYDSITQSPINPITESPSKPITQSPNNLDTQSLTNPITQSPYDSITHPPSDTITTPFSREKSDETHVMDDTGTTDNQRSGSEDTVMRDLRPRLCHIVKDEQGFGFNLHCDKQRVGQFIRSVDPDSPAHRAGLQPGDRLVQVNGRNIEGLRHSEVVQIIRGGGEHARLLVVDPETDELFKKLDITPTPAHLNEDCVDGPLVDAPASTCPLKGSSASPPVIHSASPSQPPITDLDVIKPPIRNESLKQQSHGVSSRSITSETSVMTECNSAPGVQEVKLGKDLDPLWESGLRLSPTAAEARQKVSSKKANKRAPPMAWNKKYEIFCNF
ncbi:Na(+)/H(+) exchange regulatory cofactor NHE-RF2 isoform X2 [Hemibagrus wyckioides]|uniref:Na(+)/H(+) exchange regulatory cofactor NHE-RF2 isoform X2 n=1 Tax=Hemibagrus wyckioides TaxID=337641 RepID=UPI00266BBED6|nr:Na(+)/H(+) exchange regulatory cofactor NHE-RF2 isoform X2 [Hemibagrus wyckioides]